MTTKTYDGSCHCQAVRFRVTTDLDTAEILDCNCSICTKKGFLHLILEHEQFELVSGAESLTEYRFNTGAAKHQFCRICGIHPFYIARSDPNKIDVNLHCLNGVDFTALKPVKFDGQNWEEAIKVR
jgi:hypothetical protein